MQETQCCVFDFTLFQEFATKETIMEWLKQKCKKWAFQLEKGEESSKLHFQGRFSLKSKIRRSTLLKLLQTPNADGKIPLREMHVSVTSCANRSNDFYVTKDETRVEGPWKDTDPPEPYVPKHLRVEKWIFPWQQTVWDSLQTPNNDRIVNCIICPVGKKGKSTFCDNLGARNLAIRIPYIKSYQDVMRQVMDQPKLGCYMVDLPRGLKNVRFDEMYSALETVKDGYAYDERYHYKCEYFDRPHIWTFCNNPPDLNLLSPDRWRLWTFNDALELVEYGTVQTHGPEASLLGPVVGQESLLGPILGRESTPVGTSYNLGLYRPTVDTNLVMPRMPTQQDFACWKDPANPVNTLPQSPEWSSEEDALYGPPLNPRIKNDEKIALPTGEQQMPNPIGLTPFEAHVATTVHHQHQGTPPPPPRGYVPLGNFPSPNGQQTSANANVNFGMMSKPHSYPI